VVDRASRPDGLAAAVHASVLGGVDRVQLRDRTLEGADWLAFADRLAAAARGARSDVEIVVNRRVDVALAIGADGVHLGFDAMAIADARLLLGPAARIGVSAHGVEDVREAIRAGADYVHLAPIFDPLSKPVTRPALGLATLAEACRAGGCVVAQGGITADNAASVVEAGAAGVAVTGTLLTAADPEESARQLRAALDAAAHRPHARP